jgi:hypothetical protein
MRQPPPQACWNAAPQMVFGCLFRRGLSLRGNGSSAQFTGAFGRWPVSPGELPQTTMSPQYLQFTKGRGRCNKNSAAEGVEAGRGRSILKRNRKRGQARPDGRFVANRLGAKAAPAAISC